MKRVFVFRHVPHEGLGTIESFLTAQNVSIRYCDLFGNGWPPAGVENVDYAIAMGGPMNADETERYPFLALERAWIEKAIAAGVPVLGICLGAQLVARALGARVYSGPSKEIGWYRVRLTDTGLQDSVFRGCSSRLTVFQWHGDTFDLPAGAVSLASSALFEHQAFRFQNHVHAFQFHIEVTERMIQEWIRENTQELESLRDAVDPVRLLSGAREHGPALEALAASVYPKLFAPLMAPCGQRSLAGTETP